MNVGEALIRLISIRDEYGAKVEIKLMGSFLNCSIKCEKRNIKVKVLGNDLNSIAQAVEEFDSSIKQQEDQTM